MLELIIAYLRATVAANFQNITEVHGLAELIQEPESTYPKLYCTGGDYKNVGDLEKYIYFRQTGPATEAESDEEAVSGCDHLITRTHPMIAVVYIPKDVFNTDNAFIDGKVANNVANIIRAANYGTLLPVTKADNTYAEIKDIDTNRHSVWGREFRNVEMAARLDHVYCSVEFDLIVEASESCLRNYDCNDDLITVDGNVITIIIQCEQMTLLTQKENVNTFIEEDYLKGHVLSRIALWAAGTELTTTNGAISSYDPVAGRINFAYDLGGETVKILIID
jgi:hypothetical protein